MVAWRDSLHVQGHSSPCVVGSDVRPDLLVAGRVDPLVPHVCAVLCDEVEHGHSGHLPLAGRSVHVELHHRQPAGAGLDLVLCVDCADRHHALPHPRDAHSQVGPPRVQGRHLDAPQARARRVDFFSLSSKTLFSSSRAGWHRQQQQQQQKKIAQRKQTETEKIKIKTQKQT